MESSAPPCRAHDVRKVATAMRPLTTVALDAVFDAGQWSSPHTFLRYYNVPLRRSSQLDIRRFTGLSVGSSSDEEQRPSE